VSRNVVGTGGIGASPPASVTLLTVDVGKTQSQIISARLAALDSGSAEVCGGVR
jgi:hypothetical protein